MLVGVLLPILPWMEGGIVGGIMEILILILPHLKFGRSLHPGLYVLE